MSGRQHAHAAAVTDTADTAGIADTADFAGVAATRARAPSAPHTHAAASIARY
jgi:hypothetical protein